MGARIDALPGRGKARHARRLNGEVSGSGFGSKNETVSWRLVVRAGQINRVTQHYVDVIIEQIFVIPGMGLMLLDAVNQRDYPIITGVFLIVGVGVMLINLLVDLSYGLLDPRVRNR